MSLKDKASKINFAALAGTPAQQPADAKGAKTAPGELMAFANQQRSQLLQENEELKAKAGQVDALQRSLDEAVHELEQWDGAKATRLLDPECIVRSRWANRHELNFEGEDFEVLRSEIRSAGGNIQPIKVRPIGEGRFEIVFGHRRHEACRLEGLQVLAMIDNLDDKSLFAEMDRENRARKNLSAYEQGVMYRKALAEKLFQNQKMLAAALGASEALVTKALALADLPVEVVNAFPSPMEIQYRFAKPINDALKRDFKAVVAAAKELAARQHKGSAKDVLDELIAAANKKIEPFNFAAPVVFEVDGVEVGDLSFGPKGVKLSLKSGVLDEARTIELTEFVKKILHKQEN